MGIVRRPGPALLMLLLACGGRPATRAATPDPMLRRSTTAGDVVGFTGRYGSAVWLGVPFAAPPVGARRWRAAEPPPPWEGVREATRLGSPCVQYAGPFSGIDDVARGLPAGSEDCLYLNVYAPRAAAPGGGLPVMVWIHGGGNSVGHAGFYDGGNLAARENVVVVTVNYRLGPFGWFRHNALRGDDTSPEERSGNFGNLDHVRALEWVRDNAAAFGGDSGNVTVFGESAGGRDVLALLVAPPARSLFQRAIVQSGGLRFDPPARAEGFANDWEPGTSNASGDVLVRMLVAGGLAPDASAAQAKVLATPPDELARLLRERPAYDVLRAYPHDENSEMIDLPQVFGDGTVLPSGDALDSLRSGAHHHVPVMLGNTRDEAKLFLFNDPKLVRRWFGVIPRLRDPATYEVLAEYQSRMWQATGAHEPAAALAASQREPVFVYRFDWDEEPSVLGAELSRMLGAAHAFEIPFIFGHWNLGREGNVIFSDANLPGREALSAQMMGWWAQFARTGDPGRGQDGVLPEWPRWSDGPRVMVLDTPSGGASRPVSEEVTRAGVIAAIDADPRLPTQRDKCRVFWTLAKRGSGLTPAQYPGAGARGCEDFPWDSSPWSG
jgi:para-nitrobenzyl esterase